MDESSFCEDTVQPCTVVIESLGRQVNSQTWAHSNSQRLDILSFKRDIVYTYLPPWVVMKNWMKYLWRTLVHYKGLYIYVKCFYYKENILRYILWGYIITCRNTKWNTSACKLLYATDYLKLYIQLVFPGGSDGKASAYNAGDLGSIPGSGRSPGEGNGNPFQYSCQENPMDRGAW